MTRLMFVPCRTCGRPVLQEPGLRPLKLVGRSGSFRANGVERPSLCAISRVDPERPRATGRRYQERHREVDYEKNRAYSRKPEICQRRKTCDRLNRKLRPEVWRERSRWQTVRRREREGRARLIREYRQNGQDLLTSVRAAVPRHYDRATGDAMIGEAVMLALEGATIADAVKAAVRAVNTVEAPGRYAKPIEDCFWL